MRQELARTFLDNIYLEKEVEKLKWELSHQADFTCIQAFKLIFATHKTSQNQLDPDQFTQKLFAFSGKGHLFDKKQAVLLFIRYATPKIGYPEF